MSPWTITSDNLYALTIPGQPLGKPRPRCGKRGEKIVTYSDPRQVAAEAEIALLWRTAHPGMAPLTGNVGLTVYFWLKKARGAHQIDLSNLVKLVEDALNGVAYADDKQIVRLESGLYRNCRTPQTTLLIHDLGPPRDEPVSP